MDLGLYLHVPFCRCKCDWCAFASEPGVSPTGPWREKILDQLSQPPEPGARWVTAYFGGGTPSLLDPGSLDRLLEAVGARLVAGAEVTFEANPESLTADHLAVLAARGVTRLSLGVQSFNEAILSRHGRPTRRVHLDRARKLVDGWPGSLSLDLIAGLEGQTEAGQRRDLDEALDWNPDHLSFYALGLEPETPLGRRAAAGRAALPETDEADRWWLEGVERIEAAGLGRYEVSNFARPGAESVHNQRYWALEPWWGLGPSAASFFPGSEGRPSYRTEVPTLAAWLSGVGPVVEVPTELELAKDRLLSGLRRTQGVSARPWMDLLPETITRWKGRIVSEDDRLFLTAQAFPWMDGFLREAFAELDGRPEFR